MKTLTFDPDYNYYPGGYVPLLDEQSLKDQLRSAPKGTVICPTVNISETLDGYTVQLTIPGVKREELLIAVDGTMLSVSAVHQQEKLPGHEMEATADTGYTCFGSEINLPGNIDPDFVSAEYREGILRLDMLKGSQPAANHHTRIYAY
jgi:HSP20 family molecular chaperone IbpA